MDNQKLMMMSVQDIKDLIKEASKVSVAKAMEPLVKRLHKEHALVHGQAK